MTMSLVRIARWRLANARVLGVGAALAAFIGAEIVVAPPLDGVGVAGIVLPALTASIVAGVFAVYRDGFGDATRWVREGLALAIWFAASLVAMWLTVAFMYASVDAYQWLGMPLLLDFAT